jgi:predicted Zn-dependent protease
MLSRNETKSILDRALGFAKDGELELALEARLASHTRFARNAITTSGHVEDLSLAITSRNGSKAGTIATNDVTDAGLKAAVARARDLREAMPPDPEAVETLPKQDYPVLEKFHAETLEARAGQRIGGVKATLDIADRKKLTAAGFYENGGTVRAIASTKGIFGWHASSEVSFSTTMRTADATGSGWASGFSPRFSDVHPAEVAGRAAEKGVASAHPREVPPGDYTVILEPEAIADLLEYLRFGMLSARAADEGRSVFSKEGGGNRIGETLFADSVTIASDPFDPRVPGTPWTPQYLPNRKVTWIEKGVLKTLETDRYWAATTKRDSTPAPTSLVMAGGSASRQDLIAGTDKGLLVTRFWYIRMVNPQTAQLTGLTRDGLFLIEKGKVTGPAVNLRFNESPVVMLQNVEALTPAVPAGRMVVPAVKARAFTFTSKSDAV